jgi:NADPH:quinone reductase-like Zn-dependent oxidoreductase
VLGVVVITALPLGQAAAAHALLEQGHTTGKIVLAINPEDAPDPVG